MICSALNQQRPPFDLAAYMSLSKILLLSLAAATVLVRAVALLLSLMTVAAARSSLLPTAIPTSTGEVFIGGLEAMVLIVSDAATAVAAFDGRGVLVAAMPDDEMTLYIRVTAACK